MVVSFQPSLEQSKKEDIAKPDDAPEGEEDEKESKVEEESKEKEAEEVAEGEIEEEDADKNVRRRTRRQAWLCFASHMAWSFLTLF